MARRHLQDLDETNHNNSKSLPSSNVTHCAGPARVRFLRFVLGVQRLQQQRVQRGLPEAVRGQGGLRQQIKGPVQVPQQQLDSDIRLLVRLFRQQPGVGRPSHCGPSLNLPPKSTKEIFATYLLIFTLIL